MAGCVAVASLCVVAVQRQMGLSNGGQHFLPWSRDRTERLRPVMGGLSLPKLRFIPRAVRVVVVVNKVALGQASVLPCHNIPPLNQTRMLSGTNLGHSTKAVYNKRGHCDVTSTRQPDVLTPTFSSTRTSKNNIP